MGLCDWWHGYKEVSLCPWWGKKHCQRIWAGRMLSHLGLISENCFLICKSGRSRPLKAYECFLRRFSPLCMLWGPFQAAHIAWVPFCASGFHFLTLVWDCHFGSYIYLVFLSWQICGKSQAWFPPILLLPCLAVDVFLLQAKNKYLLCDQPPWQFLVQEISRPLSSGLPAVTSGCRYISTKVMQMVSWGPGTWGAAAVQTWMVWGDRASSLIPVWAGCLSYAPAVGVMELLSNWVLPLWAYKT